VFFLFGCGAAERRGEKADTIEGQGSLGPKGGWRKWR